MKVPKSFSIEEEIYKSFETLTNRLNVNKSSIVEDKIKEYLKDNGISDYRTYYLISNTQYEVNIVSQDNTFIFLSDGSKMLKTIFETTFKPVEKMDPVDPLSFFKNSPLIIKFLMPNMDKFILTQKLEEDITKSDKLTGKLFIRDDKRVYRVVEDNTGKWVRIRPQEQTVDTLSHFKDDMNVNRDYFLKTYKPYKICHIDVGGFGFEYLGKSRIDDNPIFKLGGGVFTQFFNADIAKLKEYIMNNRNVIVATDNHLDERLYININEFEVNPLTYNNITTPEGIIKDFDIPIVVTKTRNEIEWEKEKELKEAITNSMKSEIVAGELKQEWDEKYSTDSYTTQYEQTLCDRLEKIGDDQIQQISFINDILEDMTSGTFQKEFTTSGRIKWFLKNLSKIKTPDPNSTPSKLKFNLLTKIVKYHNEIYG